MSELLNPEGERNIEIAGKAAYRIGDPSQNLIVLTDINRFS